MWCFLFNTFGPRWILNRFPAIFWATLDSQPISRQFFGHAGFSIDFPAKFFQESFQCLVCAKWFAIPPVKHMRGHFVTFRDENRRHVPLTGLGGSCHVCLLCFQVPIKKIFLWPMPLFLLSTHKQCILSHFVHNSTAMFSIKNLMP
jgi:hypothetical protein